MGLKQDLMKELKEAMQNKDVLKKETITMLRAAILQIEKDNLEELTDSQIQTVVAKEVKKRKEAIPEYEKGSREDIVETLKKEIEILSKYLPEQLTEEEIKKLVEEAVQLTGATSMKDMGKVMANLREKTQGKADGKLVSDLVKEKLMNL